MLSTGGTTSKGFRLRAAFTLYLLFLLVVLSFFTPQVYAQAKTQTSPQSRDLVVTSVSPGSRVILSGHRPSWASTQNDLGALPADMPVNQLALVLARSADQQQAFDQFLSAQQDPASPDYHHWLTPVELGERFGATQHDIDAITNWLQSQNLHVDSVANSRMRILFSGTASNVANAFGAEMHYFQVDGERRMSIFTEPQIPAALAAVIESIHGLSTIKIQPAHGMGLAQVPAGNPIGDANSIAGGATPDFTTSGGSHFLFPADFAKIYDVPVGSFTGAGQTIAVIGISRVNPADITNFQSLSGLSQVPPTEIIPTAFGGTDPGPAETAPPMSGTASQGQGEATLDVTRAASIAPGATIDLVVSGNGIDAPMDYVVDTNPVPAQIMTISFGSCENGANQNTANFFNSLFSQAAAEGISVFVSSGDGGAAGCDTFFVAPPTTAQILSTNIICASSFLTCTGGTEFADAGLSGQYWTSNGVNFESALSYIPEGAWNEPGGATTPTVAASGGGFSVFIPTPSYQAGAGVPGTQGRYTPDVAFSSAGHDGYFACFAAAGSSCTTTSTGSPIIFFLGTSAAAPDMAGIAALLNQKMASPQGNLNPRLYALAATPGNNVFHDVTVASSAVSNCVITTPSMCNNSMPSHTSQTGGLSGYQVGVGYDEVTGLGSIDVANLLTNWGVIAGFGPIPSPLSVTDGQSLVIPLTILEAPGSNLSFMLSCSGLPVKATCTFSPNPAPAGPPPNGTTVQLTFGTASSQLPAGPSDRDPSPWEIYGMSAALAAVLIAGMSRLKINPRRRWAFGACAAMFALAVVMLGCGGSSSNSASTPVFTGTPKGATTFMIVGTSGTTTISAPITITVQ